MEYKTTYWNDVDSVELPKVIDDEFISKLMKKENSRDQYSLITIYGICGKDMTDVDMSNLSYDNFLKLNFDTNTIFSKEQIEQFQPDKLLRQREEYYENLDKLHKAGIDGRGINIVIIDDPFDHTIERFKNVKYNDENVKRKDISYMHGTTVTSIVQSIAPSASISFYANKLDGKDMKKFNEDRKKVLSDIANGNIKADIVSLSGVIYDDKNDKYINQLKEQGCEYIDSNRFSKKFTHGNSYNGKSYVDFAEYNITDEEYETFVKEANISIRNLEVLASQAKGDKKSEYLNNIKIYRNSLESKEAYQNELTKIKGSFKRDKIVVLSGGITYTQNDGIGGRTYCGKSSQSWAIPQVSATYALAKQMDKNISYDEFCEICEQSEKINGMKIINPEQVVRKINEMNKEKSVIDDEYKEIYEKSSTLIGNLDRVKENELNEKSIIRK